MQEKRVSEVAVSAICGRVIPGSALNGAPTVPLWLQAAKRYRK